MAWCLIVQVFMSKLLIVEIFGQKSWAEGKSHAFFLPGHLGKYAHLITWSRPVETVALHTQQVCLTWSNPTQSPIQNNSHYVRTNTRCAGTVGEVLGMESVTVGQLQMSSLWKTRMLRDEREEGEESMPRSLQYSALFTALAVFAVHYMIWHRFH